MSHYIKGCTKVYQNEYTEGTRVTGSMRTISHTFKSCHTYMALTGVSRKSACGRIVFEWLISCLDISSSLDINGRLVVSP